MDENIEKPIQGKSQPKMKVMGSMEVFKRDGEQLEIIEEKIDDILVSGPVASVKIGKSLRSKKLMNRI